jgi:segregation and condensation protein B
MGPPPAAATVTRDEKTGGESDRIREERLEAVLFLAREPLSTRKLAQLAGLTDGTEARTLITRLRARYDARSSSFQIKEVAGGFQLLTRSVFARWLRRLHPGAAETRLSVPAMETLAVVAYCQPVLRADIEAVRGVQCGEILRQLMDRDLVRIMGRSEELGRPFLYGTTRQFLQWFGLRHLDDLPRADLKRILSRQESQAVEKPTDEDHDIRASKPPNSEPGG